MASLPLAACGPDVGNGSGNAEANACGTSHASVTADQLYKDIVQDRCQSCHNPNAQGTTLMMDSVEALKAVVGADSAYGNGLKIIEANRSENSTMYLKVLGGTPAGIHGPDGESVGARMPASGPVLTEEERKKVQDWICTGAK
ncbi:MAG: c-type cytochrome [Myxococcaceae bacterium]